MESFRKWAIGEGKLDDPHHPNVWGALSLAARKEGFIRETGELVPAKSPRTHRHFVRKWEAAR